MTPAELKQTLSDIETIRVALTKARETAQTVERRLAQMPDMTKTCKIFDDVQTNTQYCENDLASLTFPLDISELNALLSIDTKVKNTNGGPK